MRRVDIFVVNVYTTETQLKIIKIIMKKKKEISHYMTLVDHGDNTYCASRSLRSPYSTVIIIVWRILYLNCFQMIPYIGFVFK